MEGDNIEDPPLSELGLDEARNAKRSLEQLIAIYNLPEVDEVWVSPLQRTLQTAATIFPESPCPEVSNRSVASCATTQATCSSSRVPVIRVKKEIEERKTGLACDTHSSYDKIRKRRTFKRFSISCLKVQLDKFALGRMSSCDTSEEEEVLLTREKSVSFEDAVTVWEDRAAAMGLQTLQQSTPDNNNDGTLATATETETAAVEDKSMLRERTKKLFNLLAETESRSICMIGHKGYLRELERGPLGNADAELFQNCEVRVYRLELDISGGEVINGSAEGVINNCDNGEFSLRSSILGRSSTGGSPVLQRAEKIASSITATP